MTREVLMTGFHRPAAIVALIVAAQLGGCTTEPVPTYSYYTVPCLPTAAVGAPPAANAAAGGESLAAAPLSAPAVTAPSTPAAPNASLEIGRAHV